ncbi:MAG: 2,3-bisphosphoglycerate-independent phosphoglycerate mutase [Candidatus Asgardarchaeia archaeon]
MSYDGKILLIVLDGLGDLPNEKLNNMTPLEYAKTPNMDKLAKIGITGIMDPLAPGIPPGSDSAHLAIFGYDYEKEYPGRGPFEAAGFGFNLKEGDIAFRVNFASVREENGQLIVLDRRAGRISGEDAEELSKAIQEGIPEIDGVKVTFAHTVEHRAVLILTGEGLSHEVTDTDPHAKNAPVLECLPWKNAKDVEGAKKTARVVNKFLVRCYKILKEHPINRKREKEGKLPAQIAMPRGAGVYYKYESFKNRWGFEPVCIAAGPLYRGVARLLGFELIDVPGATALPNTNVRGKLEAAVKALEDHDFVFVHFKGTDVASHKRDPLLKTEFIEKVDRELPIVSDLVEDGLTIAILGDHTTPCKFGNHSGDPVPLLIAGSNVPKDDVDKFGERECSKGGLHRIRGKNLMPILMSYTDRIREFGLRPTPMPVNYIPKTWNGLNIDKYE